MKKVFLALFACFLLTACMNDQKVEVKTTEEAVAMIENKETAIMVVGSTTCVSCKEFEPVINEFVKNYEMNIVKVYIDNEQTVDINGEQKRVHFAELEEKVGSIKNTPTTLFIKNGNVVGQVIGNIDYASFKEKVVTYGFMK